MLYPVSTQEKLFSLSTRDWLNKAFLASGVGSGPAGEPSGGVQSLPQRLRNAFLDGSLNLPDQCLWNMQMAGNCHDLHFTLKSSLSGKSLAHPNMVGAAAPAAHGGLVLSRDSSTLLTFASGLAKDKSSRWTGFPTCQGDQKLGSTQRKNCLPEHQCSMCATGYVDCNTDCAD